MAKNSGHPKLKTITNFLERKQFEVHLRDMNIDCYSIVTSPQGTKIDRMICSHDDTEDMARR